MIDLRKDGISINIERHVPKNKSKIDLRKELDASDLFNIGIQIKNPIDAINYVHQYHTYERYQPGEIKIQSRELNLFTYDIVADPGFDYVPKQLRYTISKHTFNYNDQDIRDTIFKKFSECTVHFDFITEQYVIIGTPKTAPSQDTKLTKQNGEVYIITKDTMYLLY